MAGQQETMDDKELFASAITDETPEPVAQAQPEPETTQPEADAGQPRDDQGRFAAKVDPEPTPAPEPAPQPAPAAVEPEKQDATIPSWRLREVSEKRDRAVQEAAELRSRVADFERRLAELSKPKAEPVDFFADPDAALKQHLKPFKEQFQQLQRETRLENSRAVAYARHGVDVVNEMEAAIASAMDAGDPEIGQLRAQMLESRDPVSVAMQWHQRSKLLKETGGDISAYRTKLSDELLKDPAFLAKALEAAKVQAGGTASQPRTITQIPPSLNKATASASATGEPDDMSDSGLFRYARA